MNLSTKKVLIIDYGYFTGLAETLAPHCKELVYAPPWHSYNPTPDRAAIGIGLPGVTHAEEYDDHLDTSDLIIFPDVGDYSKQARERSIGHRVFGMGAAEELELNRLTLKRELDKRGLPNPKWRAVYGIDALAKILKSENDLWVKIFSKYRGIKETWFHSDWESSEGTVDYLAYTLGVMRNTFCFIIESPFGIVEGGGDYWVSNGVYLSKCLEGYEEKNEAYLCKVVKSSEVSAPVKRIRDAFAPYYLEKKSCGCASDEVRCDEKGRGYFLDSTQRWGSPPDAINMRIWGNLPEMIWGVSGGEMVEPKEKKKYGAMIVLKSAAAVNDVVPVDIEKGEDEHYNFRRSCFVGGKRMVIPMDNDEIIGAAIGLGNTKDEAAEEAVYYADRVRCPELFYNESVFEKELADTLILAESCGLGRL